MNWKRIAALAVALLTAWPLAAQTRFPCTSDSTTNCYLPKIADDNSASYTNSGTAAASGNLPLVNGATPRGVLADCTAATVIGKTTLTLSGGGTVPWTLSPGTTQDTGKAATAATAVTGCTFQVLY